MKLKTKNIGKGRAVYSDPQQTLYHTTKGFFVMVDADGNEEVLSPSAAAGAYGNPPYCSVFNYDVHYPYGGLDGAIEPEDIEFEAERELELHKRFQELQLCPKLQTCLLEAGGSAEIIQLDVDDHDEIHRLHYQCGMESAFTSNLTDCRSEFLVGHLAISNKKHWKLEFWCDSSGLVSSTLIEKINLPHVWIRVAGSVIESEAEQRLICHNAVCAILEFQINLEDLWGRDPACDIRVYPGDPELKTIAKTFSSTEEIEDDVPF